jgi:hypothetical protein
MNIHPHKKVLKDLKDLLIQLESPSFCLKNTSLFGGSIGEHFRHIIEFYLCCLSQKSTDCVNYDLRHRDKQLEVDLSKGIMTIDKVLNALDQLKDSDNITLTMHTFPDDEHSKSNGVQTSFFRELTYCMDHCIHHQSLIKIALLEQKLIHLIDPNFGVAFSTQLYRNQCAS